MQLKEDLKDVFPESGLFQYWDCGLGHQGSETLSAAHALLLPTPESEDEDLAIEALILFTEEKAVQFSTMPKHVPLPTDLDLDELMAEFKGFHQTHCNVWRSVPEDRPQTSCCSIFVTVALPVPTLDRCSTVMSQRHQNDWFLRSWAIHNLCHQHLPFDGAATMSIMLGKPISTTCKLRVMTLVQRQRIAPVPTSHLSGSQYRWNHRGFWSGRLQHGLLGDQMTFQY